MHQLDVSDPAHRVLGTALRTQARVVGDDVFLMAGERRVSFAEADRLVDSYAHGLRGLGVGPGDRVCLLMENSVEFVLVALATNRLGAVWVPVNTSYTGSWLAETIADARATVLVTDEHHHGSLLGLPGPLPRVLRPGLSGPVTEDGVQWLPVELLDSGRHTDPGVVVAASDVSSVMWTSGTTGRSKGVMQSHSAWANGAQVFRTVRQIREGDRLYCCVPMFNSGAWVFGVVQALIDGIPLAIDRRFSVGEFWDRTRYYGTTQIVTLGAMHVFLWQAPPRPDDRDNPVRCAGFIPIPHELVDPMRERFGIEAVFQGYGQSEVMPATIAWPGRRWKPNSAGSVRPDLELALLDDDDEPVSTGEVGEICVRPKRPGVIFSGYFNDPERTCGATRNLWFHTGDLGRLDEDGELFFHDRKKDVMRYKGRNIAGAEVERAAAGHPGVHQVAAHGVTSAELVYEDEVKICVVRTEGPEGAGVTAEELAAYIRDTAPYHLVPRYIEFVEELPMTPTGRVQKFRLRERGVTPDTWDREAAGFVVRPDTPAGRR